MKEIVLKISAISDVIKYSLSTTEIGFSPTMMFSSRTIEVKMTNVSQIKFDFKWIATKLVSLQMGDSSFQKCPFDVAPKTGSITPGQNIIFKVTFAPQEVDDYTAHLVCEIPGLRDADPPDILVMGMSRRPLIHFNVEMSDYLTAGRRHPDYVYALPDGIRVIEFASSGIGKRAIKKFEIINTTAAPYEIYWTPDPQHNNPVLTCEYPRMLISSGKRAGAMFSFLPVSVKTVESVWNFAIPEHNISVSFLVVGRIMPQ
jgi:hydrocephalus-inducing protein